tara:strand:+ start:258 stop:947 length:690 start_codon:yes stop_codon:yes gene_type:complete
MISVILPTLNEKKNIFLIYKKLLKLKIISEIIFVDDNSTDKTFFEIKKIKNKKVVGYLRKAKKRDLSKSIILGIEKSKNKIILVMDCDLQHDVNYIPKMYKNYVKFNCDVVVASRFLKKKILGNLGYFRSLISRLAICMISIFFGKRSSDPLSGFFMCKKELINRNKHLFFGQGYKILFDILFNCNENLKIVDQNIVFRRRNFEKSKFNSRIIWLFLRQMIYTLLLVKK